MFRKIKFTNEFIGKIYNDVLKNHSKYDSTAIYNLNIVMDQYNKIGYVYVYILENYYYPTDSVVSAYVTNNINSASIPVLRSNIEFIEEEKKILKIKLKCLLK